MTWIFTCIWYLQDTLIWRTISVQWRVKEPTKMMCSNIDVAKNSFSYDDKWQLWQVRGTLPCHCRSCFAIKGNLERFVHYPTLGCDIQGFGAIKFHIQYRPWWFQDFPAIWLAVPREANGAHLGIYHWPIENIETWVILQTVQKLLEFYLTPLHVWLKQCWVGVSNVFCIKWVLTFFLEGIAQVL